MRSADDLQAGLVAIRQSPTVEGTLEMIVRRPMVGAREVIETGTLDPEHGLVGDRWRTRGPADPDVQLTIMNVRAAALIAETRERWALAGDQLFVDFDLSVENVPAGARLAVGSAVIQVSAQPHTGCRKFVERFGLDVMTFVNSPVGRSLNLRGINARVVQRGELRTGDRISKIA